VTLFLAANPSGTDRRALDREARSIYAELKRSGYRDRFDFATRWAAEPLDLLRELRELAPTVVHISGHGGRAKAPVPTCGAAAGAGPGGVEPHGLYLPVPSLRYLAPARISSTATNSSFRSIRSSGRSSESGAPRVPRLRSSSA
jgi:hypothetical protein